MCRLGSVLAAGLLIVSSALSCDGTTGPGGDDVAQVTVSPAEATLSAGDTVHLAAVAVDGGGRVRDRVAIRWVVSDTEVALIDSTGVVYGQRLGAVSVRAWAGHAYGETMLNVSGPRPGWTGFDANCGVWTDGIAYCWMWLGSEQVPAASRASYAGAAPFILVATGAYRSCGLASDHRAYCWGNNDFGQLGDGTLVSRDVPMPVAGGLVFDSLAMGPLHTCALTAGGDVYCWGANASGQLGVSPGPETCLYAMPCTRTPVRVPSHTPFTVVAAGGAYAELGPLSTGSGFTCALSVAGDVYCWGANNVAQLGDATYTSRAQPGPIYATTKFSAVSAADHHACAIAGDGRLYCWGMSWNGELGFNPGTLCPVTGDVVGWCATRPAPVDSNERFRAVSARGMTTCGITRFGGPFCWGDNRLGQIGAYPQVIASQPVPVADARTYRTLKASGSAVCALASDGRLDCWGNDLRMPTPVSGP